LRKVKAQITDYSDFYKMISFEEFELKSFKDENDKMYFYKFYPVDGILELKSVPKDIYFQALCKLYNIPITDEDLMIYTEYGLAKLEKPIF